VLKSVAFIVDKSVACCMSFRFTQNITRLQTLWRRKRYNSIDIGMGPSFQPVKTSAHPSNISEFQYLPWVIVLTFFCYFSILALCKYCNSCICIIDDDRDESTKTEAEVLFKFEDTFESYLPGLTHVLFFFRLLSFTYIAGVPVICKVKTLMFAILF
jgi:hypothetical protein